MRIGKFEFKFGRSVEEPKSMVVQDNFAFGPRYPVVDRVWDGEKTLGELGAVIRNVPDYDNLRLRMYDAYATKDIVSIIASKYFYWTIGSGLKLQCEPNRDVLESEGISGDSKSFNKFQKIVEARFMVYANSKESDFLKQKTLHEQALDFFKGTWLGGDTLCIARFDKNGPNTQFISGEYLRNPTIGSDYYDQAEKSKNKIEHGIEVDNRGAHIAYFVNVKPKSTDLIDDYERIPAIGAKTGKRMAWLISGKKISPDHLRGVPAMAQSLEKINKLDRYTEATVGKAEQGAKILLSIEHQEHSTGEDVFNSIVQQKKGYTSSDSEPNPNATVLADGLALRIAETTSNQTFNMPQGAVLKSFTSQMESKYGEFHSNVFDSISAGADIPPEVAMQKYSSNYSASRAAINSFGYIISINRDTFANNFYKPFFKLWLEHQILSGKIEAPGYIENIDNFMVTDSYSQCRFTGKNMPHIDPLKEIKAVREMLGVDGAVPLISREQAVELLNAGQWDENFMKSLEEEGVIPKEDLIPTNSNNDKKVNNDKKQNNVKKI